MTAYAGLPLSSKGLAEKLGFANVAAAAALPGNASEFVQKLVALRTQALTFNSTYIADALDELSAIDYDDEPFDSFVSKINGKISGSSGYEALSDASSILAPFVDAVDLSLGLDEDYASNKLTRLKGSTQEVLDAYGKLGNLTEVNGHYLTYADFLAFGEEVQLNAKAGLTVADLLSSSQYKAKLKSAIDTVLADNDLKVAKAFAGIGIDADDYYEIISAITDSMPSYNNALKTIILAEVGLESVLTQSSANGGSELILSLKYDDFLLDSFIEWRLPADVDSAVSVNGNRLVFSTGGTYSGNVSAVLKNTGTTFDGKVLMTGSFSHTYSSGGSGPITSDPGTGTDTQDPINDAIEDAANQLETATPEQKTEIVTNLVEDAQKAIDGKNVFDSSMKSTETDGTSTVVVSGDKVMDTINEIAKLKDEVKKVIDESGTSVKPPVANLTIDVGSVPDGENTAFKVPADIVKAAKDAGLDGITLTAGVISYTIPLGSAGDVIEYELSSQEVQDSQSVNVNGATETSRFVVNVGGPTFVAGSEATLLLPSSYAQESTSFTVVRGGVNDEVGASDIIDGGAGDDVVTGMNDVRMLAADNSVVAPESRYIPLKYNADNQTLSFKLTSLGTYTLVERDVKFNDIASVQSWAGTQIKNIAAQGAIQGKSSGVFAPTDNVTRAEFAKMLTSILSLVQPVSKSSFTDVTAADWYAPYVNSASMLGVINGRDATTFAPNANITRAEMATMIARALKYTQGLANASNIDSSLAKFSDGSEVHDSLKEGVAFAVENGIIVGSGGKFKPNDNATRAEAAVILYRAFNYEG